MVMRKPAADVMRQLRKRTEMDENSTPGVRDMLVAIAAAYPKAKLRSGGRATVATTMRLFPDAVPVAHVHLVAAELASTYAEVIPRGDRQAVLAVITAAYPAAMAASAGAVKKGAWDESVEGQTEFTVYLNAAGNEKIMVIAALRESTALSLEESENLAKTGGVVVQGVSLRDASIVRVRLAAAGADVVVR
jgi:large subunit ribosomal protein L7/L12